MSGRFRGVQARILALQPKATYTHYASHRLNLSLLKACSELSIKKLFSTVNEISNFERDSPKRVDLFKKIIREHLPSSNAVILINLCETRWVESHEAVIRFSDMLMPSVLFLEEMVSISDGKILSKCNGLLYSILNFEFIFALEVAIELLSITLPISRQLQDPNLDLTKCIEMIKNILNIFKSMKSNTKFCNIFKSSVSKAKSLNIEVKTPRICNGQTYRSNVLTSSTEEYFKITVFFTILGNFIVNIQSRFLENQNSVLLKIQQLIPRYLNDKSKEDILEGAVFYESDLPGNLNELKGKILTIIVYIQYYKYYKHNNSLGEIILWKMHWTKQLNNQPKISTAIQSYAEAARSGYFPNISQLLLILAVLPVTTCTCERLFSTLKRIKTYLRSTMGENRLNGLALLNIHKEIDVKPEDVLDLFSKQQPYSFQFSLQ